MYTTVVDGSGRQWPDTVSLAEALGSPIRGVQLRNYLVRNAGYVAFFKSALATEIWFNPNRMKPRSGITLLRLLSGPGPQRCLVNTLGPGGPSMTLMPASSARTVLGDALSTAALQDSDRFESVAEPLSSLHWDDPFRTLLGMWSVLDATDSLANCLAFIRDHLDDRATLIATHPAGLSLKIVSVGAGFQHLGRRWRHVAPQLELKDLYDLDYGAWATESYKEVARTRRPLAHAVTALIKKPQAPVALLNYRRLVLPFVRGNGLLLLGATQAGSAVSLISKRAS